MGYFDRKLAYYQGKRRYPEKRLPWYRLQFYHPLSEWKAAETGQTMSYAGRASDAVTPVQTVYDGVPCCLFDADCYWRSSTFSMKADMGAYGGTMSCWVASRARLARWKGSDGIVAVRKYGSEVLGLTRYGVEWRNSEAALSVGKHDNAVTFNGYDSVLNDVRWHHYAVSLICEEGWTNTSWRSISYFDGRKVKDVTNQYVNNGLNCVSFGTRRQSAEYGFYIAGVRVYGYVLPEREISLLAGEYVPDGSDSGGSGGGGGGDDPSGGGDPYSDPYGSPYSDPYGGLQEEGR